MPDNDKPILIYTTFPSPEAAEDTGAALVDLELAACVNIIPGMTSIYRWEGERQRSTETIMVIKTRSFLADAVTGEVRRRHAYENPALLVLPVAGGSTDFLHWIMMGTRGELKSA